MHHHGDGVSHDKAEAARLFRLAAEQGSADAMTMMMFYLGDE
jgi:TPR repeat protein